MHSRLLLLAGLAGWPLLGKAQTAPSSSPFYVGLGAAVIARSPFQEYQYRSSAVYGPALTAGIQASPRWALQIGLGVGWKHEEFQSASAVTINSSSYHTYVQSIPVLTRYTFTPLTARLHVDALGGFTLAHSSTRYSYTGSYHNGPVYYSEDDDYSDDMYSFSLGPAARYTLAPNVELTANAVVNTILNRDYYGVSLSDRLYLSAQVGAHYTFGTR